MSSRTALALAASSAACALAAQLAPAAAAAPQRELAAPSGYIVVLHDSVSSAGASTDALERRGGFKARYRYSRALKGFAAELSPGQVAQLRNDPAVRLVVPDRPVHASVDLAPGEPTPPTGIRRLAAATATTVHGASSVNVAVIDTGVDLSHPDINAASGKNCITSGAAANDDHGHGSHVAGTIGGLNNGAGVVGVAPGTKLYAVKVLDSSGSGTESQVICGIDWATGTRTDADPSNDISVANMSLGGLGPPLDSCPGSADPEHIAICNSTNAGVTYVVAAGNSAWDFDYAPVPDTPAAYPEVLTVTAMSDSDGAPGATGAPPSCRTGEADDRYASFSNYAATAGGVAHTIAGPGVCITSTWKNGGYTTISGTSMATPHLAGAVALCLGEGGTAGPCAGLTAAQIVQSMRSDAGAYNNANSGFGFSGDPLRPVGVFFGYLYRVGLPSAGPDTTPPSVSSVSPADTATGVATTTSVSVFFSEPMDKATAESAFSLTDASVAAVPGAFSWSGNTMTFKPSSALAQGATYSAAVSTTAKDLAGNPLAQAKTWSFTTSSVTTTTAFPGSTTILTGSLRAGGAGGLAAASDGLRYQVNSAGGPPVAQWYGSFSGVPGTLANLLISYRGGASRPCTQTLSVWRFSTGTWVQVDSRNVGTADVAVNDRVLPATESPANFVGPGGELRVRVRCTRSSNSFYTNGDLLKIVYDA